MLHRAKLPGVARCLVRRRAFLIALQTMGRGNLLPTCVRMDNGAYADENPLPTGTGENADGLEQSLCCWNASSTRFGRVGDLGGWFEAMILGADR
jgi:hypothetical protein